MRQKRYKNIGAVGFMVGVGLMSGWMLASLFAPLQIPSRGPAPEEDPPVTQPEKAAEPRQQQGQKVTARNGAPTQNSAPFAPLPGQPGYAPEYKESGRVLTINGKRYPLRQYQTLAIPNDPSANQWWVTSSGLATAWDYGSGAYTPTIAIIDTGFALQHEEFAGRWYANAGEQGATTQENPSDLNCTDAGLPIAANCNNIDDDFNGIVDDETGTSTTQNPSWLNCTAQGVVLDKSCNLIDDDGNGLKDDVRGWDFSNYDQSVQAGEVNPNGGSTTHGTMVAGILGATGNNAKGIAGVNWSAKILPLQAIDDNGYGDTLTVARAVRYAADQKADIISLSLGGSAEDPYLRESISYAISKGSLVVAASGNDGCDCILYPARYAEVLAVGASNSTGAPATFSSYGAALDLLAPGQDMTAPTWSPTNQSSAYASGVAGTSFATPYVSGLLGLAKSHMPQASWGELVAALLEQSDHRSSTPAAPHSTSYGYGYVLADKLLGRLASPQSPAQQYRFGPVRPTDTLDSSRLQICPAGGFPATPVYELVRGAEVRFTASPHASQVAAQNGWVSRQVAYSCVGLPPDAPSSIRTINLLSEIRQASVMKPW